MNSLLWFSLDLKRETYVFFPKAILNFFINRRQVMGTWCNHSCMSFVQLVFKACLLFLWSLSYKHGKHSFFRVTEKGQSSLFTAAVCALLENWDEQDCVEHTEEIKFSGQNSPCQSGCFSFLLIRICFVPFSTSAIPAFPKLPIHFTLCQRVTCRNNFKINYVCLTNSELSYRSEYH